MGAIDDSEDTTKVAAESANDFDDSAEKGREAVWPVVELDAAHPRELVDDFFKRHAHTLVRWLKRRFGPGPPDPEDFAKAAFTRSASLDDPVKIRDKRTYHYTITASLAV